MSTSSSQALEIGAPRAPISTCCSRTLEIGAAERVARAAVGRKAPYSARMLALLLACHPTSSPPDDDSAPSEMTDTGLDVFNPETDLDWQVVEGTDGDCGTSWPVRRKFWEFESTLDKKPSDAAIWVVEPALSRADVWDATLGLHFPAFHMTDVGVVAHWRVQCDRGSLLLIGLTWGTSWRAHGHKTVYADSYGAAFAEPVEIGLADSTFDVAGELWSAHYGKAPDSMEPWPATFTGTITNMGTEAIAFEDGKVDAAHLVVATDAQMFVQLFPSDLWLAETEGLVQFQGPIENVIATLVD